MRVALAQNGHTEYWKVIDTTRGEAYGYGTWFGFEWFASWAAVKRFRWYNPTTWWPYLTTRGPSPLGWVATSAQCRRELTEESLAAKADREKRPANGVALLTMVLMMQAQKTRGNKRHGWTPDGQSLEASL